LVTHVHSGVIAVDLNVDHLAVVAVDRKGKPLSRACLPFPEAGTDENRAEAMIGEAVAMLCAWAKALGFGIACEQLDFGRKKSALKVYGKRHARRLSGFAYARFFEFLEARCKREGVDLAPVSPAFTSIIGVTKYARWRGLSRHHAAGFVIGRRALGFGERLVCMDGSALDAPGRMRSRHAASRWRGVRPRRAREVAKAAVRTARSLTGSGDRGRRKTADAVQAWPGRGPLLPCPEMTSVTPPTGGAAVGPPAGE
jgi:IS605 OrfB family transposase